MVDKPQWQIEAERERESWQAFLNHGRDSMFLYQGTRESMTDPEIIRAEQDRIERHGSLVDIAT